jgi:hypothetical protein
MVSTLQRNSNPLHRLARFVSKQAAAMMFNLKADDIYSIEHWANIVYVRGKGVSRFVSYADFPPTLGVAPPTEKDFAFWRRRWKQRQKQQQQKQAPPFWTEFFAHQFHQSTSVEVLHNWGELIGAIKFAFGEDTLQHLRENYFQEKMLLSV